jgi:hypothetical protein
VTAEYLTTPALNAGKARQRTHRRAKRNDRMGTNSTGARMTRLKAGMELPFFKGR